jgi:hypothetical protein
MKHNPLISSHNSVLPPYSRWQLHCSIYSCGHPLWRAAGLYSGRVSASGQLLHVHREYHNLKKTPLHPHRRPHGLPPRHRPAVHDREHAREPRIGRNPDGTDGSTERIVNNGAQTLHGGVIMDVITPEQARIAEEAGVCAIMAIERVPADIRAQGGVARMSDPGFIHDIKCAVTIPVMAKAHNGHFVETQILEAIGVDYVDDCEVLTLADDAHHINKHFFHCPGKDHGGHPCAKHLLGDDISGNKKGVCNMLATANAITKLLMGLEIKVPAVPAAPPWRPPDARRNVNNLLMQQSKNLHEARFTRHTRHLSDIDQRSSFAQLHLLKGRNNCDTSTMESGSDVDDLGSPMMRNTLERSSVGCSRLAPVREEMQTRARDSTAYYGCDDHFAVVDKTVDYGQGGSMSDRSSASEIRPEARPLHTSRAPHMPTEDINLFHDPISCNSSELFQSHETMQFIFWRVS